MKIALVQLDITWLDIEANIDAAERLIWSSEEADLYVFPEMWATGFCTETPLDATTALEWMKITAHKKHIALAGSLPIQLKNGKFANRFYFVTPDKVYFYDKRHLFRYGDEHLNFEAGKSRTIVKWKNFNILLQVCYDLRFPVFSRNTNSGYDMILYVACWPTSREKTRHALLVSRAIENQSYVACVNRTGREQQLDYNGNSCVISPEGEYLLHLNNSAQIACVDVTKEHLVAYRHKYPFLADADPFQLL